jgi:hypothetical protein
MPSPVTSTISREDFARFGTDRIAYVRQARSEDVGFMHPEAPLLPPGRSVFVLHGADGRPLVIAGSLESVLAGAASQQLDRVSLH